MKTTTALVALLALPLSLSLLACAAEIQTPDPTSTGTGVASGSAAPSTGSKPEVGFSCGGEVSPRSMGLETAVSVRCVGAGPDSGTFGTNCAPPAPTCAPQDVAFRYEPPAMRCPGTDLFAWDGKACIAHNTHGEGGMLVCKGNDCDKTFATKAACEAAHETCPR